MWCQAQLKNTKGFYNSCCLRLGDRQLMQLHVGERPSFPSEGHSTCTSSSAISLGGNVTNGYNVRTTMVMQIFPFWSLLRNKFLSYKFLNDWTIWSLWSLNRAAAVNSLDGISLPCSFIGLCGFGTNNVTWGCHTCLSDPLPMGCGGFFVVLERKRRAALSACFWGWYVPAKPQSI